MLMQQCYCRQVYASVYVPQKPRCSKLVLIDPVISVTEPQFRQKGDGDEVTLKCISLFGERLYKSPCVCGKPQKGDGDELTLKCISFPGGWLPAMKAHKACTPGSLKVAHSLLLLPTSTLLHEHQHSCCILHNHHHHHHCLYFESLGPTGGQQTVITKCSEVMSNVKPSVGCRNISKGQQMAVWHVKASMVALMLAETILWCDVMTMLLCDVDKLITVFASHWLQQHMCCISVCS